MNETKLFYVRNVNKAFKWAKAHSEDGLVRVSYVNGVTGGFYVKKHHGMPRRKLRAYVRRCWSGWITPLTFEVTQ